MDTNTKVTIGTGIIGAVAIAAVIVLNGCTTVGSSRAQVIAIEQGLRVVVAGIDGFEKYVYEHRTELDAKVLSAAKSIRLVVPDAVRSAWTLTQIWKRTGSDSTQADIAATLQVLRDAATKARQILAGLETSGSEAKHGKTLADKESDTGQIATLVLDIVDKAWPLIDRIIQAVTQANEYDEEQAKAVLAEFNATFAQSWWNQQWTEADGDYQRVKLQLNER